MTICINLQQ